MVSLEWRRERDMAWLPPGAPLEFGKTVVLRGVGYGGFEPNEFILYRIPTKLVSWALTKRQKPSRWEFARRPAWPNTTGPVPAMDSESVVLVPSGFGAAHRWQFSDWLGNWSPVVRTTRFSTLKASLTEGHPGVVGTVEMTVQTTVDPRLRIDLSLPWELDKGYPSPQQAIILEVEALRASGVEIEPVEGIFESLGPLFPSERPSEVDISWEPQEVSLDGEETRTFQVPVSSVSSQPFAFCFVATNTETEEVEWSEVAVLWREEMGSISEFGMEG